MNIKAGLEIQRKSNKGFSSNSIPMKSGLEIHQQLNTKKLFCNCDSELITQKPDFVITRKLFPVAGETGKIDPAAKFEFKKGREYVYEAYNNQTCLIELDEEPPKQLNLEALEIVLKVALMLNCKILPSSQIMRKTVIDGSNVSGFQRTVMIAKGGFIITSEGKVKIQSVVLEEDAARKITPKKEFLGKEKGKKHYRLDRLGIPLIEIATDPDIKSPEQAKETALKIGRILRMFNVKRGIGTIRQDVNISTKDHPRVEIKGVQDPRLIVKTINYETERQKNTKNKESHVRRATANGKTEFLRPLPGKSRMYPETDLPLLKFDKSYLKNLKLSLPILVSEEEIMKKYQISKDLARDLIKNNQISTFEILTKEFEKIKPAFIGELLVTYNPPREILSKIFSSYQNNQIGKNSIIKLIKDYEKNKEIKISKYEIVSKEKLEKIIKEIIRKNKNAPIKALIGLTMKQTQGKADGKTVSILINKLKK